MDIIEIAFLDIKGDIMTENKQVQIIIQNWPQEEKAKVINNKASER